MTDERPAARSFAVRPAAPADAPEIARVHVESWQATYPGIVPPAILDGLSIVRRTEFWSQRLVEPGETRTWIGELDDRIVGFVGTNRPTDPLLALGTGEVESIYLLPVAQGLGLGRLLLDTASGDLHERGFSSAILWVLTANEQARRFYEAAGWRPDGMAQMIDFDGTPVEEIRFRIGLPGSGPTSI